MVKSRPHGLVQWSIVNYEFLEQGDGDVSAK